MWCKLLIGLVTALVMAMAVTMQFMIPPLGDLEVVDLTGHTFVITGASSGLGLLQAKMFAQWNASVVLAVRNKDKGIQAARAIKRQAPHAPTPKVVIVDLASFASIRKFPELYEGPVDVLIHNAATLGHAGEVRRTEDGFEECLQVNFLSTVLLTQLLMHRIEKSPYGGRIVHVSAEIHEDGRINPAHLWKHKMGDKEFLSRQGHLGNLGGSYADSKLLQLLFMRALSQRLAPTSVTHAVHPGVSQTSLFHPTLHHEDSLQRQAQELAHHLVFAGGRFLGLLHPQEDAAKTLVHVATHPALHSVNGHYFTALNPPLIDCGHPAEKCARGKLSELAASEDLQEQIFKNSCDVLHLRTIGMCGRPRQNREWMQMVHGFRGNVDLLG